MIIFNKVSKKYNNDYIFRDVSLQIESNTTNVLIGPSGFGKTTICKIIAGIESYNEGEVIIDNLHLNNKNLRQIREKVGFIFQDFNLFHHFNVYENISYSPLKVYKKSKQYVEKMIEHLFKRFSLEDSIKYRKPKELSGGQKQRVAIIRALMFQPKILIFDEPTASLDYELTKETINIINELKDKMTIVTITHDFIFAKKICDNLIYFNQDKQLESTNKKEDFIKLFEV